MRALYQCLRLPLHDAASRRRRCDVVSHRVRPGWQRHVRCSAGGSRTHAVQCYECGVHAPDNANFCVSCGHDLRADRLAEDSGEMPADPTAALPADATVVETMAHRLSLIHI